MAGSGWVVMTAVGVSSQTRMIFILLAPVKERRRRKSHTDLHSHQVCLSPYHHQSWTCVIRLFNFFSNLKSEKKLPHCLVCNFLYY